jgi:cell division protein FtsL
MQTRSRKWRICCSGCYTKEGQGQQEASVLAMHQQDKALATGIEILQSAYNIQESHHTALVSRYATGQKQNRNLSIAMLTKYWQNRTLSIHIKSLETSRDNLQPDSKSLKLRHTTQQEQNRGFSTDISRLREVKRGLSIALLTKSCQTRILFDRLQKLESSRKGLELDCNSLQRRYTAEEGHNYALSFRTGNRHRPS